MQQVVLDSIAGKRFSMTLLAAFFGLALLLASIGIYGFSRIWSDSAHATSEFVSPWVRRGEIYCV